MQSLIISGKTFRKIKTFPVLFLILCSLLFTGCGGNFRKANFSTKLSLIDGYITQNETDDALSYLKKAQKSAYSVAQRLSIIKRYRALGADSAAEKFLLSSMKKLPDSVELTAVYVQQLLDQGRIEEALPYAQKLKGSWFDSLYVETCLRQVASPELFYESRFSDMYQSAFKATRDSRWLRNSAILLAVQGDLKNAARLHPGTYSTEESPFFWALLDYDAENYNRSIEGCKFIIQNCTEPEDIEAAELICSDAWLQTGDIERAYDFWLTRIASPETQAPAVLYKNAAHYAILKKDNANARSLLLAVTELYPEYVPGLVAYVNFAIAGDAEEKAYAAEKNVFRTNNLKTLAMEAHDAIPRIPLADAMKKLDDSLAEHYSPELLVEYTRVCWQMENASEEKCLSEVWSLLEKTRLPDHYEPYMVRWAVSWLCAHHNEAAASELFSNFLVSMHGMGTPSEYIDELEDWECELAAWFALKNGEYEDARLLYENRMNVRDTMPDESVLMNCAAVYTAEHNYLKALEIYSALAPEIEDPVTLSEVQYRIGVIQYDLQEKRNALLSLTYSVKLNPDNHRARLLLKQIE
ncbi:MAG: hypothetical protein KBT02_01625 [Treponema sp.]|nr:hypothetical protein [Candidatus Treponema caballi]